MKSNLIIIIVLHLTLAINGQNQKGITIEFTEPVSNTQATNQWSKFGSNYTVKVDSMTTYSKKPTFLIQLKGSTFNPKEFLAVSYSIPKTFEASELKVVGKIKTEGVTEGSVGLFASIEGNEGYLGFDNMLDRKIKGSNQWEQHEIKLPYNSEQATKISFGAVHNGNGKFWVSDLKVYLDDVPIEMAKLKGPKIYPAELDKDFDDLKSNFKLLNPTSQQVDNLKIFGLIWGFLKYHHPYIMKGNINWDYEALRQLPKVVSFQEENERNAFYVAWINGLGNFELAETPMPEVQQSAKLKPDFKWIDNNSFSERLRKLLYKIQKAKTGTFNYYLGMTPRVANPIFKNEASYKALEYPDQGFQLLSLYRFWNIIEYYFPYKHLMDEDWYLVLEEFIPKVIDATDELKYKMAILELIGKVQDSHADIRSKEDVLNDYWGKKIPQPIFKFIENKLVVTGFYEVTTTSENFLKVGDVLSHINNVAVDDLVKCRLKYTPGSNRSTQLRELAINLVRTNEDVITLRYERNGEMKDVVLKTYPLTPKLVYSRFQPKQQDSCFQLIQNKNIAYLNLGNLKTDYLPRLFEEIEQTKGLIIDIRNYPKEFFVFSLSAYLMPRPVEFVKFTSTSVENPGFFTFGPSLPVGGENPNYYKGKVVILVDESTQSMAEYTAMALSKAPKAIVLGCQTAGADGNVSRFFLPGGISTMISGIGVYYPDGRETQRQGIKIDMEVKPSIKGVREARDELLDVAIQIIKE
jgi:C-terminal processing protease CtpA/Prc